MGTIRSRLREITKQELEAVAGHADWYHIETVELSNVRVIEFDVAIDSVVKYQYEALREDLQLHVLRVGPVEIGFEVCFMDRALVTGLFPTDHLRVAFMVRQTSGCDGPWEDATGANWAIGFYWESSPVQIEVVPYSERIDHVLSVYRLAFMQQAEKLLRSPE